MQGWDRSATNTQPPLTPQVDGEALVKMIWTDELLQDVSLFAERRNHRQRALRRREKTGRTPAERVLETTLESLFGHEVVSWRAHSW